jgi:hypothetical protein
VVGEKYRGLDPARGKQPPRSIKADGAVGSRDEEASIDDVSNLRGEAKEWELNFKLDSTGELPGFVAEILADGGGGVFHSFVEDRLLIREIQSIIIRPLCPTRIALCFDHLLVPFAFASPPHGEPSVLGPRGQRGSLKIRP